MLLKRSPSRHDRPREMVVDIDHHIVNFWRAVKSDPEAVAHHCDHPQFHADLSARHKWLVKWGRLHRDNIIEDPEYCDPKPAGWWVWGISLWIGGGWCADKGNLDRTRPLIDPKSTGGHGVHAIGQIPNIKNTDGNQGIHSIGKRPRIETDDHGRGVHGIGGMPFVDNKGGDQGINAIRKMPRIDRSNSGTGINASDKINNLIAFMAALSERLKDVIVLGGNWKQCLGPTPLMHTATSAKPSVGILLDPPYLTKERVSSLYQSDVDGTSSDVAIEAWEWAKEHGDTYRIAYCCHAGDFDPPSGWTVETQSFGGVKNKKTNTKQDCIMFSPACGSASMPLFDR